MAKVIYRGSTPHFRLKTNRDIDVGSAVVLVSQACSCSHCQTMALIELDGEGCMYFSLSKDETLKLNTHAPVKFQLKIEQAGEICYSNIRTAQVIDALDTGTHTTARAGVASTRSSGCECNCEFNFTIDSEFVIMGEYEVYDGVTEITPSLQTQTFYTQDKVLKTNLSVLPIELSETPNVAGGLTLMIG